MWVWRVRGSEAHTNLGHKDKPQLDPLKGNYRDCQKLGWLYFKVEETAGN